MPSNITTAYSKISCRIIHRFPQTSFELFERDLAKLCLTSKENKMYPISSIVAMKLLMWKKLKEEELMNRKIVLGEVEVIGIRDPWLGPALLVNRFGGRHCCQRLELEDFGSEVEEGRLSHRVRFPRIQIWCYLYSRVATDKWAGPHLTFGL